MGFAVCLYLSNSEGYSGREALRAFSQLAYNSAAHILSLLYS
jgi:hypothetical protein